MDESKRKSSLLFDKAMDLYRKENFSEALNYFKASYELNPDNRTDLFIKVCGSKAENKAKNPGDFGYKKAKSTSAGENGGEGENSYRKSGSGVKEESKSSGGSGNDESECLKIINKKDFYSVLSLPKTASAEEIKRAYKKLAVKFHPDKNKAKSAEEAFKKISEAYQCLSDPEKKQFYDKYGDEAEYRANFRSTRGEYEEEFDPFDVFEMFFGGNMGEFRRRGGRVNRRRANFRGENTRDTRVNLERNQRNLMLIQFLPFLFLILFSVLPNLIGMFKSPPLYQFTRSSSYNHKRKTTINKIEYFVSDKFVKKYPKINDIQNAGIEPQIELEFLQFVGKECSNVLNTKRELEFRINYAYNSYQQRLLKEKLNMLDYKSCKLYQTYKDRIG